MFRQNSNLLDHLNKKQFKYFSPSHTVYKALQSLQNSQIIDNQLKNIINCFLKSSPHQAIKTFILILNKQLSLANLYYDYFFILLYPFTLFQKPYSTLSDHYKEQDCILSPFKQVIIEAKAVLEQHLDQSDRLSTKIGSIRKNTGEVNLQKGLGDQSKRLDDDDDDDDDDQQPKPSDTIQKGKGISNKSRHSTSEQENDVFLNFENMTTDIVINRAFKYAIKKQELFPLASFILSMPQSRLRVTTKLVLNLFERRKFDVMYYLSKHQDLSMLPQVHCRKRKKRLRKWNNSKKTSGKQKGDDDDDDDDESEDCEEDDKQNKQKESRAKNIELTPEVQQSVLSQSNQQDNAITKEDSNKNILKTSTKEVKLPKQQKVKKSKFYSNEKHQRQLLSSFSSYYPALPRYQFSNFSRILNCLILLYDTNILHYLKKYDNNKQSKLNSSKSISSRLYSPQLIQNRRHGKSTTANDDNLSNPSSYSQPYLALSIESIFEFAVYIYRNYISQEDHYWLDQTIVRVFLHNDFQQLAINFIQLHPQLFSLEQYITSIYINSFNFTFFLIDNFNVFTQPLYRDISTALVIKFNEQNEFIDIALYFFKMHINYSIDFNNARDLLNIISNKIDVIQSPKGFFLNSMNPLKTSVLMIEFLKHIIRIYQDLETRGKYLVEQLKKLSLHFLKLQNNQEIVKEMLFDYDYYGREVINIILQNDLIELFDHPHIQKFSHEAWNGRNYLSDPSIFRYSTFFKILANWIGSNSDDKSDQIDQEKVIRTNYFKYYFSCCNQKQKQKNESRFQDPQEIQQISRLNSKIHPKIDQIDEGQRSNNQSSLFDESIHQLDPSVGVGRAVGIGSTLKPSHTPSKHTRKKSRNMFHTTPDGKGSRSFTPELNEEGRNKSVHPFQIQEGKYPMKNLNLYPNMQNKKGMIKVNSFLFNDFSNTDSRQLSSSTIRPVLSLFSFTLWKDSISLRYYQSHLSFLALSSWILFYFICLILQIQQIPQTLNTSNYVPYLQKLIEIEKQRSWIFTIIIYIFLPIPFSYALKIIVYNCIFFNSRLNMKEKQYNEQRRNNHSRRQNLTKYRFQIRLNCEKLLHVYEESSIIDILFFLGSIAALVINNLFEKESNEILNLQNPQNATHAQATQYAKNYEEKYFNLYISSFLSIFVLLLLIRIFFSLKVYQKLGQFIKVLKLSCKAFITWLILFIISLSMFTLMAVMLFLQADNRPDCRESFKKCAMVFFAASLGEIDYDDMSGLFAAEILMTVFVVTNMIMLLNILIAMLSSTYTKIVQYGKFFQQGSIFEAWNLFRLDIFQNQQYEVEKINNNTHRKQVRYVQELQQKRRKKVLKKYQIMDTFTSTVHPNSVQQSFINNQSEFKLLRVDDRKKKQMDLSIFCLLTCVDFPMSYLCCATFIIISPLYLLFECCSSMKCMSMKRRFQMKQKRKCCVNCGLFIPYLVFALMCLAVFIIIDTILMIIAIPRMIMQKFKVACSSRREKCSKSSMSFCKAFTYTFLGGFIILSIIQILFDMISFFNCLFCYPEHKIIYDKNQNKLISRKVEQQNKRIHTSNIQLLLQMIKQVKSMTKQQQRKREFNKFTADDQYNLLNQTGEINNNFKVEEIIEQIKKMRKDKIKAIRAQQRKEQEFQENLQERRAEILDKVQKPKLESWNRASLHQDRERKDTIYAKTKELDVELKEFLRIFVIQNDSSNEVINLDIVETLIKAVMAFKQIKGQRSDNYKLAKCLCKESEGSDYSRKNTNKYLIKSGQQSMINSPAIFSHFSETKMERNRNKFDDSSMTSQKPFILGNDGDESGVFDEKDGKKVNKSKSNHFRVRSEIFRNQSIVKGGADPFILNDPVFYFLSEISDFSLQDFKIYSCQKILASIRNFITQKDGNSNLSSIQAKLKIARETLAIAYDKKYNKNNPIKLNADEGRNNFIETEEERKDTLGFYQQTSNQRQTTKQTYNYSTFPDRVITDETQKIFRNKKNDKVSFHELCRDKDNFDISFGLQSLKKNTKKDQESKQQSRKQSSKRAQKVVKKPFNEKKLYQQLKKIGDDTKERKSSNAEPNFQDEIADFIEEENRREQSDKQKKIKREKKFS